MPDNYTDYQKVKIAKEEYNINKINQEIRIDNNSIDIGKVSSVQDGTDSGSGEQV